MTCDLINSGTLCITNSLLYWRFWRCWYVLSSHKYIMICLVDLTSNVYLWWVSVAFHVLECNISSHNPNETDYVKMILQQHMHLLVQLLDFLEVLHLLLLLVIFLFQHLMLLHLLHQQHMVITVDYLKLLLHQQHPVASFWSTSHSYFVF